MTVLDEGDPGDDRLAELLARIDDARTTGRPGPDCSVLSPGDRARLEGGRTVLDLLDLFGGPAPGPAGAVPARFPFRFGRFVVRRRLGAGGCAVVYLADDTALGRAVALKLPRLAALVEHEQHRRFLQEAKAAAILSHPNIVPVFEADAVDGLSYIASEYCPGPNLTEWLLGRTGPVPVADCVALVAALAAGIGYAHRRGVVHRDLKPSNVLLAPRDGPAGAGLPGFVPLIADFGFAKLLERDLAATASGAVIGTPLYMSPEQAEGRTAAIGPAADVYALGAVLFELLTGRPPIVGTSTPDTLRRILTDVVRPPQRVRPEVPRDLGAICLKCLEKDPARRYPDGDALAADLTRFAAGMPTLARPVPGPVRAAMWVRRNPLVAALAVVVTAALGLVAGVEAVYRNELGRQNAALRDALAREQAAGDEAERQREVAVDRFRTVRRQAYLANVRDAADLLDRGLLTDRSLGAWDPEYGEDLRGFEWGYLARLARGTRTWARHRAPVNVSAVSADGRWCATASGREVRTVEIGTGRIVAAWTSAGELGDPIAVSADGRRVAVVTTTADPTAPRVHLFVAGTPAPVEIGAEQTDWSSLPVFVGADALFVSGQALRLHDTTTGAAVRTFGSTFHDIRAHGTDPSGSVLAVSYLRNPDLGACVGIYDPTSGRERALWPVDKSLSHLMLSDDGKHVLVAEGNVLRLRAVGDGTVRSEFPLPTKVHVLDRLTDGRLVAATWPEDYGSLQTITLATWDPRTDRWSSRRVAPPCPVHSARLRPDGTGIVVGGMDATVHEMDLERPPRETGWAVGAGAEVWAVAVAPDGRTLVTGGDDHMVRVWDRGSGALLAERTDHNSLVTAAAFAGGGRWLVTAGFDGWVVVRDPATAVPLWRAGHGPKVRALAVSPDGSLIAAAGASGTVSVWEVASGQLVFRLEGTGGVIHALVFSHDGTALITAPEEKELVWFDVTTWRRVRTVPLFLRPSCMARNPVDGGLVVGFETGQLVALDSAGGPATPWPSGPQSRLNALAFSPDGRTLATAAADGTVALRQAGTGAVLFALARPGPQTRGLAFAPDGSSLAAARHDGRLILWPAAPIPR